MNMSMIEVLGIVLPSLLIFAAVWGIFSKHFLDNLVQRVALCCLIVVCVIRLSLVGERGAVDLSDIALYVVLLTYAVGVVFKVRSFVPGTNHRKGDSILRPVSK